MTFFIRFFVFASFLAMPHLGAAQQPAETPLEIGDSGRAYLQAIRFRGIDTNVGYFDPTSPPPPMETEQQPKAPPKRADSNAEWSLGNIDAAGFLLSAAVLLALIYVFARFGGGISVSLRGDAENAARAGGRANHGRGGLSQTPGSLDGILRMQDRREALVQLAKAALATVVAANGVLLQRSWTAREALRHLPADQVGISALRSLVHASERVHFGGRDVSEEEFQVHVENIRPLLRPEVRA